MIECNPKIVFGQPALKGRRLTVYDIVTKLYYENDIKITVEDYEISMKEIEEALDFCMNLKCKEEKKRVHYCDGCVLRSISEGWSFEKNDFYEISINGQIMTLSKDGKTSFLGSISEFENSEFGKITWAIAEHLYKKYFSEKDRKQ